MIDITALNHLLEGVEGFLHPDEPAFLANLAAQVEPGHAIVEIGSYRGRSTIALAYGAPDGVIVYAVDPHEEHEAGGYPFGMADNQAFMENVSRVKLGHKIRVINLNSLSALEAWRPVSHPIGLIFVDGAHDYRRVLGDVQEWQYWMSPGGLLAMHDSAGTWADPTRVADELSADHHWLELDGCAYTRVFRKGNT